MTRILRRTPSWIRTHPIILILGLGVIIGLGLGGDYRQSVDEPLYEALGSQTLRAYRTLQPPAAFAADLGYYGPFFNAVT